MKRRWIGVSNSQMSAQAGRMSQILAEEASQRIFFYHQHIREQWIHEPDAMFPIGHQASTIQTAVQLQNTGYHCELVDNFSIPGVYVCHEDMIKDVQIPNDVFILHHRNDRWPLKRAQCEVVQNPLQADESSTVPFFYIPFYPQVGIIPRDHRSRQDRIENVYYIGRSKNLNNCFESAEFKNFMARHGFQFSSIEEFSRWHDYSQADVVLAVRDFDQAWNNKPASKLVNSWHAEVPAILGPESAYRALRKSGLDYIEVRSLDDVFNALLELKSNRERVKEMRANGTARAQENSMALVTQKWIDTLENKVKPLALNWFLRRGGKTE